MLEFGKEARMQEIEESIKVTEKMKCRKKIN
jgi:hypothetical protein